VSSFLTLDEVTWWHGVM